MPKCWPLGELTPMKCPLVTLSPVLLSPEWATATLPPPQNTLQDQQVGLPQATMKSLLLPWLPVHTGPCMHPLRVESLFLSLQSLCRSPMELLQSSPAGLQSQMVWGLLLQCQTPRLWSLMWGLELSLLWENFCDIIVLQFVGRTPGGVWNLIISGVHPFYCLILVLLLSLDVKYLF